MPPSRFCPLVNGECHAKCIFLDPKTFNCLLFAAVMAILSQSDGLKKIEEYLFEIEANTSSISDQG